MTHLPEGSTCKYEEKKGQRGYNGPKVSQGYVATENGVWQKRWQMGRLDPFRDLKELVRAGAQARDGVN